MKFRDRFWAKVNVLAPSECWEWQGYRDKKGYGHYSCWPSPEEQVAGMAHRFAYEFDRGPIPEGLTIDHLCRNRACVNPSHLEAVPHIVNVRRGTAGARNRSKTHCKRGHPFSGENLRLVLRKRGAREWVERKCRECERFAARKHQRRKRAVV